MLRLRAKSTLWLFYTLLLSYLFGRTRSQIGFGKKKKQTKTKKWVDSWKALPLHGMSNTVVTLVLVLIGL